MLTQTRTINEEKNDLAVNHNFSIPENIKNDINEKWFHLYKWIWEDDIKQSIERDFLSSIKTIWPVSAVILLLPTILIIYSSSSYVAGFWYFVSLLIIINVFLLIYLTILAIARSNTLRKNAYVLLTDSSISVNWNIRKISEFNSEDVEIKKISNTFEEEIFKESNIKNTKQWFIKQVFEQLWKWYQMIFKLWDSRNRNSFQIILIWILLYTIYALSLWMIYFIWIFFIWIFWNILSIVNKNLLLISWHKITKINSNFEDIDSNSNALIIEKDNLWVLLNEAKKNDWKDSLLLKINEWIKNINENAWSAVDTSINLKKIIESSKYNEMFNFSIYNSWIKKQILVPLLQIVELLEKNLNILKEQNEAIWEQIKNTPDPSLSWPLLASKTRIEMRIVEIEKHIGGISGYIGKLR